MKKRSLFAAVAMLIVSAIVLTSATFAWFQTGGSITIDSFSQTTTSASGGLRVSATGAANSWKTHLTQADYTGQGGNNFPSGGFTPVDGTIGSGTVVTFKAGSLAGDQFNWTNAAPTGADKGYIRYTTYIMAPSSNVTVTISPTLSAITGESNPTNIGLAEYIYYEALLETDTTGEGITNVTKQYDANAVTNKTYNVISGTSGTYNDANPNSIMDSADGNSALTLTSSGTINAFSASAAQTALSSFTAVQGVIYKLTVTVWAEGQDDTCVSGSGAASTCNVGLALSGTAA